MENIYEKDYSVITIPIFITFVVLIIFLSCSVLADAVSLPIQHSLGASQKEIVNSQNITLIKELGLSGVLIASVFIFAISYAMFLYLQYGFYDGLIPYKRDIYGKKIKSQRRSQ